MVQSGHLNTSLVKFHGSNAEFIGSDYLLKNVNRRTFGQELKPSEQLYFGECMFLYVRVSVFFVSVCMCLSECVCMFVYEYVSVCEYECDCES